MILSDLANGVSGSYHDSPNRLSIALVYVHAMRHGFVHSVFGIALQIMIKVSYMGEFSYIGTHSVIHCN